MDTTDDKPPDEPASPINQPPPRSKVVARRYSGSHSRHGQARWKFIYDAKGKVAKAIARSRIARELIDPAKLAEESALQESCFFPYQYMDPFKKTQLFADQLHHAKRIYGAKRGLTFAVNRAGPFVTEKEATISAHWAARQEFDRRGMDYGKALMWIVERSLNGKHKVLPRPNQVFSRAAMDEAMDMWLKHGWWEISYFHAVEPVEPDEPEADDEDDEWKGEPISDDPTPPLDPRFLAVNYVGDPEQNRALDALEVYVRMGQAGYPKHRLSTLLHRAKLITHEEAVRRFGPELVAEAEKGLGYEVEPVAVTRTEPHLPGCFGFGPVAASPCDTCRISPGCAKLTAIVDGQLIAAYGSTDPRAVRKREANRKHQAASRARKKPKPEGGGNPET